MPNAAKELPGVTLCKNAYETCENADALVLMTEWNQFRMLDLDRVRNLLREPVVVDLRNVYDPVAMRSAGFRYDSVGRP
jgi:UDPglucose 6-dehydrogenase